MGLADAFKQHSEEIVQAASSAPFIVFLCGPNVALKNRSARLRRRLKRDLEKDGFEVVLGEDEGLDNSILKNIGINPQDNEMEFIRKYCGAVVIVADSVGAFCELGLFSWHLVHDNGMFDGNKTYCIVLLNEKYQNDTSYLNLGPVAAIDVFGRVEFINFSEYDNINVLKRLRQRRGFSTLDKRGRPRKCAVKKVINAHMTLFAVGVLQPASPREVRGFLKTVFSEGGQPPTTSEFAEFLEKQCADGRVVRLLPAGDGFYSLTLHGANYLPPKLRRSRDKFRMYLLRDAHRARITLSRGDVDEELAGASPAVDTSTDVKGRAANKLGRTTFGRRFAYGQAYWPRIQGQFVSKTGPSRTPRDTFPNLLSFVSKDQVNEAGHLDFRFDYFGLGLCLSISPQLIWKIANAPDQFYRSFTLRKKGGGERPIESPRIFLKVIQWFLADYVFDDLPVHPSVHSFTIGRSIATNALQHEHRAFVGNVDIENFFGSITRQAIFNFFLQRGFDQSEADILSRLCTKQNRLPQGAPTSPVIANAILYEFDRMVSEFCAARNLIFSRYADDITVSGDSHEKISEALNYVAQTLQQNHALRLNREKTRIASRGGQQRVTGVVVNEKAAPPRILRRNIRSAFHEASKHPEQYSGKIAELGGYLGYLKMFPKFSDTETIQRYEAVLREIRGARKAFI